MTVDKFSVFIYDVRKKTAPDSIDATATVCDDVAMKSLSITTNEERTNEKRRVETNGSPMRKWNFERKFYKARRC